jgi:hypothetical protein
MTRHIIEVKGTKGPLYVGLLRVTKSGRIKSLQLTEDRGWASDYMLAKYCNTSIAALKTMGMEAIAVEYSPKQT